MARKKKQVESKHSVNPTWVVTDTVRINGRIVEVGTELSIAGERGRFRFVKHVKTPDVEWIDVVGGVKGQKAYRSFRPERVRTVHYKNKLRENSGS